MVTDMSLDLTVGQKKARLPLKAPLFLLLCGLSARAFTFAEALSTLIDLLDLHWVILLSRRSSLPEWQ